MPIRYRHDHARCAGAHEHAHSEQAETGIAGARPFAFTNSPRHFERDRPFAIEHLALDLALDFAKKSIRGAASLTLRRIDPDARKVELDAIAFTVDAVTVDGKDVKYTYDGRRMTVEVPPALGK